LAGRACDGRGFLCAAALAAAAAALPPAPTARLEHGQLVLLLLLPTLVQFRSLADD
jgi:hypothetical protein